MNTNDNMKITFEEFTVLMKEGLENCFSGNEEIDISIKVNPKVNGNQTAIELRRPNDTMAPNIYLSEYYDDFKTHQDLSRSIHTLYEDYLASRKDEMWSLIPDEVTDKLFLTVINTDMNTELLKQVPLKQVLDLSVIVRVLAGIDNDGIGTALVTHSLLDYLHLTEEQLFAHAKQNTRNLIPIKIESLNSAMSSILDESLMFMFDIPVLPMYVISNKARNHGAGSLFIYPDTLETVHQQIGGDYFILPSSIHDLIVVPKSCCDAPKELREMVGSINSSEVLPEEVLSNNIYHYDGNSKQLAIWSEA